MKAVKSFLEEVKEIVQALKVNYKPEKIILFGSLANGKTNESSDIDLMIIKQTKKNPWERAAEVDRFIKHNLPVDFLVYTPEEVKERIQINDFFIKEIMERGQVIYEG